MNISTFLKSPRVDRVRQTGSGLIEVIVLIFVMSLGMLAMGKIHTVLLRDSGTAQSRAAATSLAQQKLDDLKSFKWIDQNQANEYGENCGSADINCFTDIVSNAGGRLNAGVLVYPSGNVTLGNTIYNRSWTVQDNYYCTNGTLSTSTSSSCPTLAIKALIVTVSWQDANGSHNVALRSAIARDDSLVLSFTSGGGSTGGEYGPKVNYVAGTAPDVVPVPIQQGSVNKETTKPLPDVVSAGNSIVTKFETVTYNTDGATSKQQLDDFLTVTCNCKFTTDGPGYTASYYYWDAESKTLQIKYPTTQVTKNRGVVNGNGQDPLCTSCCNDHHDKSGTDTPKYDTQRPTGDYSSGNHNHYYYVNASNPALGLQVVPVANNSAYLESCRYLRVDGVYRLMQDWIAKDLIVLPKANYLTDSTKLASYQSYIQKVVQFNARSTCLAAASQNSTATTDCETISQSTAPTKTSALSNRNLSGVSGAAQLLSRALFIDPVYKSNAPTELDSDYYNFLAQRITANQTDNTEVWLDIVPFNEVNTTLLTSWDKSPTTATGISVTDQTIVDVGANVTDYYGVYSRGLATVTGSANADVVAYLLPGNSGLTGGLKQSNFANTVDYDSALASSGNIGYRSAIGMDRDDHRSANRLSDSVNITSTATAVLTGTVRLGNRRGTLSTVTIQANGGGTPTNCIISGEGNTAGFSCPVPSGFTGTVTATTTTSGDFLDYVNSSSDAPYNVAVDGTAFTAMSGTFTNVTGPTDAGTFWLFSSTAEVRGTLTCTPEGTCGTSSTISVTANNGGSACTVTGTSISCPVPLTGAGKTWSGAITMADSSSGYALQAVCGTGGASVNVSSVGPTDAPSTLNMCATQSGTPASCTLDGVTVSSGQSIVAFSTASPTWPQTCSGVSQTRFCSSGSLNGSNIFNVTTCNQNQVAPVLSWSTTVQTVNWGTVENATGYNIYTCTSANKNALTSCTPNVNATAYETTTGTSYVINPAKKDTICVKVRASTSNSVSSASSATYCLYLNAPGSAYTYSPARP